MQRNVTMTTFEAYQVRGDTAGLLSEGNRQFAEFARNGLRSVARSVSEFPSRLRARRDEQRSRRQTVRELNVYTDRELLDLGFSRADFPAILDGTYRR